jgi:hypothetical protein
MAGSIPRETMLAYTNTTGASRGRNSVRETYLQTGESTLQSKGM